MIKNYYKAASFALAMLLFSCSTQDIIEDDQVPTTESNSSTPEMSRTTTSRATTLKIWDFNDLNEWQDATQVGVPNYWIENGNLNIFTNANTWDRTKIKSIATYATGSYSWRVYIPTMGVGDCASIGAFLYADDTHELDFEIGYGKETVRQGLNAASDDLIVYATSQANPSHSFQSKIKRDNWYTLTIDLSLNTKKKYVANWKIDNQILTTKTLTYGTATKFKIFCSVENLSFIGDHIPYTQNHALFDWVEFK
ncbi:hypothetical protein [Flavobacterium undicola]|uniref:hypothetical protein n=1 Tax=Flavobacterium undicola TaxID=1932779 RepID=UPI001F293456|nr:hypothetical protein [Flavobacterium undicola]